MPSFLLLTLLTTLPQPAPMGEVHFDAQRGECVDAAGQPSLVPAVRGPCGDWRGAHLAQSSFANLDLRGARFDGADLKEARFTGADLFGASFVGANLQGAVLTGARLDCAHLGSVSLVGAHLEYALLAQADLAGADLRLASLYQATFEETNLRGARFSATTALLEGVRWRSASIDAATVIPYNAEQRGRRHLAESPLAPLPRGARACAP